MRCQGQTGLVLFVTGALRGCPTNTKAQHKHIKCSLKLPQVCPNPVRSICSQPLTSATRQTLISRQPADTKTLNLVPEPGQEVVKLFIARPRCSVRIPEEAIHPRAAQTSSPSEIPRHHSRPRHPASPASLLLNKATSLFHADAHLLGRVRKRLYLK